MLDIEPDFMDRAHRLQHQRALARSQSKGGTAARGKSAGMPSGTTQSDALPLADAELVQLHIRVIALENLVVAMLAEGSDQQFELAREMADYISPGARIYSAPSDYQCGRRDEQSGRAGGTLQAWPASAKMSLKPPHHLPVTPMWRVLREVVGACRR